MELVMDAIKAIRARRSEMNVPPSKKAELTVVTEEQAVFTTGIPFRMTGAKFPSIQGGATIETHTVSFAVRYAVRRAALRLCLRV